MVMKEQSAIAPSLIMPIFNVSRLLELFVKVVSHSYKFQPSKFMIQIILAHFTATCLYSDRDVCTECSSENDCHVTTDDVCSCDSECFYNGRCCSDVEHLLRCFGNNYV